MPQGLMLIAYDGSDNAKRAVDYAGRFLSANRAVLVTAWEPWFARPLACPACPG